MEIIIFKTYFQEKIEIFSDPLFDGLRESRNEIQDFKRRKNKNKEKYENTPLEKLFFFV